MTIFPTPGEWSFFLRQDACRFGKRHEVSSARNGIAPRASVRVWGDVGAYAREKWLRDDVSGDLTAEKSAAEIQGASRSNLPEAWVVLLGRVPIVPGHRSGETLDEAESVVQKEPR